MRLTPTLAVTMLLLGAAPLAAQGRGRAASPDTVPRTYAPPPGMCRIWLANVPPAKQAAPTDCATAVRNRPANGRVIFGDSVSRGGRGGAAVPVLPGSMPIKTVAPTKTKPPPVVPPPEMRLPNRG